MATICDNKLQIRKLHNIEAVRLHGINIDQALMDPFEMNQ